MRKLYALTLVGAPLFLAAGWIGAPPALAQEEDSQPPTRGPNYHLESQHYSMRNAGALLQQLGRELTENERVTVAGIEYPLSGFGSLEFYVNRRGDQTGLGIEFSSEGRTAPPTGRDGQKQDYDPHKSGGRWWAAADVADRLDELAETLAATGTFVLGGHRVDFRGAASIDQRLTRAATVSRRFPYNLDVLVLFGEGEFEGPDDDEDYGERLEHGLSEELARVQSEGADAEAVARVFADLADDLRAGRARVGGETLPIDGTVAFNLTHVATTDGRYDKIEFQFQFGPQQARPAREESFGDEAHNEPTADLAAMLQRMAGQILEDGTFELGGKTFTVSRTASWEIYVSPRGLELEVGYHEPRGQ